jgi:thiamine-monophosphate kinase
MEAEFIHWLRECVPPRPSMPLALTDDAALVRWAGSPHIVVTTDLLSDGVDFRLAVDDPRRVGRKALAVNLSDLAAMAAEPLACFVSIALPSTGIGADQPLELAKLIYAGLLPLAEEFGAFLAGGDTNTHDGPLVISITALGNVSKRGLLMRKGGQPGDKLLVTGALGGSSLGHHLDFTPRVREALVLHENYELHAGIDISDGLALDTSRLAEASGCGAVFNSIVISGNALDLAQQESASDLGAAALRHALGDGEDFELLLAAPPSAADAILSDRPVECPVTCIGELIAEPGLWKQFGNVARTPLEPTGWQH